MSDTKKRSTSPRSGATGKRKKKKSAHSKARKRAAPVREDVEIDILGANKSSETLHDAAAEVDLLDGGAQPRSKVTSAALEELTGAAPLASANFEQRTARALSGEARAETGDDERVAQEYLQSASEPIASFLRGANVAGEASASDVSRIDALLTQRANARAAEPARGSSMSALLADENVRESRTLEQFVEQALSVTNVDRLPDEVYERPFVLDGLSMRVQNPKYDLWNAERASLRQDLEQLRRERRELGDRRAALQGALADEREAQLRALRARAETLVPSGAATLLKPAGEVRRINEHYREILGSALTQLFVDVRATTARSYIEAVGAVGEENAPTAVGFYMQRVAAPIFDDELARLSSVTFEDMPLTRELLDNYLERFLNAALEQLLADAPSVDQLFGTSANALTPDQRTRALEVGYLRRALQLYASQRYMQVFERWQTLVRQDARESGADEERINGALDKLRDAVRQLAEQRAQPERPLPLESAAPSRDVVAANYRAMVRKRLALQRSDSLVDFAENDALLQAFRRIFANEQLDEFAVPEELLVAPRNDRFQLLERARNEALRQIERAFPDIDAVDEFAAGDDAAERRAQLSALAQRRSDLRALVDEKNDKLEKRILFYSPRKESVAHAPDDARAGNFSPLDLAYPLDVDRTRAQLRDLALSTPFLQSQFDANGEHERANELRAALSTRYAEHLLEREIMRIEHMLENHASKTIDAARHVERRVHDTRPLVLSVELRLRDELRLSERAPTPEMADERAAQARESLVGESVTVRWYRRAPDGTSSELLRTTELAAGELRSSLVRHNSGRWLAGAYFAEADIGGKTYRSRFTATVRVMALCARDNQLFDISDPRSFGECQWREHARNEALEQLAADYRTLVTYGPAALDEMKRSREEARAEKGVANAELEQPPWGDESEANLLRAFDQMYNDAHAFRFDRLLMRAIERIARGASGGQGERAMLARDAVQKFARIVRKSHASRQPKSLFVLIDSSGVQPISATYTASIAALPLATLLVSFAEPVVQAQLTWRENRLLDHLASFYEATGSRYLEARRKALRQQATMGLFRVPGRRSLAANVPHDLPTLDDIEERALRETLRLSPIEVAQAARDPALRRVADRTGAAPTGLYRMQSSNDPLIDNATRDEFHTLIRTRLLDTGLLVYDERMVRIEPSNAQLGAKGLLRRASRIDSTLPTARTGAARNVWLGVHSMANAQPDLYEIVISEQQGAAVVRRGSQPTSKFFPFEKLHTTVLELAARYTATVQNDRLDARIKASELKLLAEQLRKLELSYNFLSLVAPAPPNTERVVHLADFLRALERNELYDFLARLL